MIGIRVKRLKTAGFIAACSSLILLPFAGSAHAASSMTARLNIATTATNVTLVMSAHLPMNQEDAQGYINNGARIVMKCYGDDPVWDNQIYGTLTYTDTSAPGPQEFDRLVAKSDGVHLQARISDFRGTGEMNEDRDVDNGDEIYCKARWTDGDGYSLPEVKTNVVSGNF